MKRIAILIACAALLNACGGGSDEAEPQVSAQAQSQNLDKATLDQALASSAQNSAAQDSVSASAIDTSDLWLIELTGEPEADGRSRSAVRADKETFRVAALLAGVRYRERRSYDVLFNGFSVKATPAERAKLAKLPGFKAMYPVQIIHAPRPDTGSASAPDLVAAVTLTGANIAQADGWTGQGVKVGVIDTGIDIDHKDLGGTGTPGGTPFPTARIVHGYDFVGDDFNADSNPVPVPDDNPDDCNGHGTHVAGIVGANGKVKGVAPGVTFGAYRVFGCDGSTTDDIVIEAMERAYGDRMDVINMSLGSSREWPQHPTAQAASRLVKKGVIVVASIGNNGPGGSAPDGLYSAGAPGVGEHVIGVASFDNAQRSFTVDGTPYGYNPATGAPLPPESGALPMTKTGTPTTPDDACAALPAGSLNGFAVLIRRGGCTFYVKSINAQNAGAAAVVLYNNAPGALNPTVAPPTPADPPVTIPVVAITAQQGAQLDAKIVSGATVLVWTNQYVQYPFGTGGLISGFSSFGLAADLSIKPNIGAPGGAIFSTYPLEQGGYATLSGTSMSSPHVAGGAALVLQAKPRTKAKNMKALLQNWAVPHVWSGIPELGLLDHVHRQGAGMLNIPAAIAAQVSVEPSEIALGESSSGCAQPPCPFTQTLKIENDSRSSVTYDITHVPAVATGPNTFLPLTFYDEPATVNFSQTTITVPRRSTGHVDVTITAPSGLLDKSIYNGYIVLTPKSGGDAIRVPFAGFKGDYQSIQVITPTTNGFPWLAKLIGTSFVNQPQGATFTMVGDDIAYIVLHLDHQAELVKLEAFNVATGNFVGNISVDQYVARNTVNGAFIFPWDGEVFQGNRPRRFRPVPNGQYLVRVTVKKALGQDINPAHFETWISPVVTIARPAAPPAP